MSMTLLSKDRKDISLILGKYWFNKYNETTK